MTGVLVTAVASIATRTHQNAPARYGITHFTMRDVGRRVFNVKEP